MLSGKMIVVKLLQKKNASSPIIFRPFGKVIEGRTSFMIAHRLSTVRNADVILVVKDGRIVESGTHAELLAAKGYYHSLYTRQYEAEATEAAFESLGKKE